MWLAIGKLTRELSDGEIVVGSGADVDWPIPSDYLNPRHFVLATKGQTASVRPSSSDVVVVVNGVQVIDASRPLKDGDVIAAGGGRFVFGTGSPLADPPALTPPPDGFLVDDAACVAYPLVKRSTSIGRDASNVVAVRDATASRFHAEVRQEAGGYAVRSMGSAGTVLNGAPLPGPRMLNEGDTIEIAYANLRFTHVPPGENLEIAGPNFARNDEHSRRPTFGSGRSAVEANNLAERDTKWLKLVVAIVGLIILAGLLWFQR